MSTKNRLSADEFKSKLQKILERNEGIYDNPERTEMIEDCITNKEAFISENGALATWTPPESTGRSPKDTHIVKREERNE